MFISLIVKGGIVMIPIILGSIIALAIILERFWALWKIRINIPGFAEEIFRYLEKGDIQKALEKCARVKHPIGTLFRLGIVNRDLPHREVEEMMEREGDATTGSRACGRAAVSSALSSPTPSS